MFANWLALSLLALFGGCCWFYRCSSYRFFVFLSRRRFIDLYFCIQVFVCDCSGCIDVNGRWGTNRIWIDNCYRFADDSIIGGASSSWTCSGLHWITNVSTRITACIVWVWRWITGWVLTLFRYDLRPVTSWTAAKATRTELLCFDAVWWSGHGTITKRIASIDWRNA